MKIVYIVQAIDNIKLKIHAQCFYTRSLAEEYMNKLRNEKSVVYRYKDVWIQEAELIEPGE